MSDSEIWTQGKEEVLSNIDNNDSTTVDIFSLRSIQPSPFLIHKITLGGGQNTQSPIFKYTTNQIEGYEFFIGNMMLSFTVPQIIGSGTVAYCDYLGYAAIERITIKIGNAEFAFSGEYLFNQV